MQQLKIALFGAGVIMAGVVCMPLSQIKNVFVLFALNFQYACLCLSVQMKASVRPSDCSVRGCSLTGL